MRVLVFGSREWKDIGAIRSVLWSFRSEGGYAPHTVVHGDCRGADKLGGQVARELGFVVEPHPADWRRLGLFAGPKRNQEMIDSHLDLALGFGTSGKGSRDMLKRLRAANIKVREWPVAPRTKGSE